MNFPGSSTLVFGSGFARGTLLRRSVWGYLVLPKGSRGMRLEKAVEMGIA